MILVTIPVATMSCIVGWACFNESFTPLKTFGVFLGVLSMIVLGIAEIYDEVPAKHDDDPHP